MTGKVLEPSKIGVHQVIAQFPWASGALPTVAALPYCKNGTVPRCLLARSTRSGHWMPAQGGKDNFFQVVPDEGVYAIGTPLTIGRSIAAAKLGIGQVLVGSAIVLGSFLNYRPEGDPDQVKHILVTAVQVSQMVTPSPNPFFNRYAWVGDRGHLEHLLENIKVTRPERHQATIAAFEVLMKHVKSKSVA